MVFRICGRLLLIRHGREPIPEDQWSELMRAVTQHPANHLAALVLTLGGAPTPTQQIDISKLARDRTFTVAVLSDSVGMRFVVSSIALVIRRIQTFRSSEYEQACRFLELTTDEIRAAEAFVSELATRPSDALALSGTHRSSSTEQSQ